MNASIRAVSSPWRAKAIRGLATFCGCALAMAAAGARADNSVDWRKIDAVFQRWDRWDSPGAAVAVMRDGKIVYARGYGSAHLEYPAAITPATVFHVASVSKQFACFAIVLLAQEGKLSLDDDVRKHLPDVPDFGQKITIRHLIHHTSGLRDQWTILAMAGWRLDDVITPEHIVKMVARQRELNFTPGSEHLYCNTGYTLLAEIVAKVSGQSFDDFTEQRIFKPLGMTNTHFHDDHERIVPGRAYSYGRHQGGYRNRVLSFANAGATSLFTSAEDLCRWLTNLDDGRVGDAQAIEQMHERGKLNDGGSLDYALGLVHAKHRGLDTVGHAGSDAGFRSYAGRVPRHKLGVVVLCNLESMDAPRLAQRVIDVVLADEIEAPAASNRPAEGTSLDVAALDRFVGDYHLDFGTTLKVTRSEEALFGDLQGRSAFRLASQSEREFVAEEIGAKLVFDEATDDARAPGLTAVLQQQRFRGDRVPEQATTDLAEFAGEYYSPELDTTYRVALRDGQLVATHQRNPDVSLRALGHDEFAGFRFYFSKVRFERDADGKIKGFRVDAGRARNVRFDRRPEEPKGS